MTDNTDNPGISIPPPLIHVLPLALGLFLDWRARLPFLPRAVSRSLGWGPALGRCGAKRLVLENDTRHLGAHTYRQARAQADHRGSVPLLP